MLAPSSANRGTRNRYWFPTPDGASTRFLWGGGDVGSYSKLNDFAQTPGDSDASYLSDADKNELLATNGIPAGPPVAAVDG